MPDALKAFLDSVAAGDDARAEEAALALSHRLAERRRQTSVGEASRRTLSDAVLTALRDMLADADPDRRWWAARGLAAVGNRAAQELLITTLADPDPDVRACAAQGLANSRPTKPCQSWCAAWPLLAPSSHVSPPTAWPGSDHLPSRPSSLPCRKKTRWPVPGQPAP